MDPVQRSEFNQPYFKDNTKKTKSQVEQKEMRQYKTKKQKQAKKMEVNFMYTTSKKITNNDAKNIISGQDLILVNDSSMADDFDADEHAEMWIDLNGNTRKVTFTIDDSQYLRNELKRNNLTDKEIDEIFAMGTLSEFKGTFTLYGRGITEDRYEL